MADSKEKDIYVALMGVTGAGKSTFISHCTGQEALAGDGLQSCTHVVQVYSFSYRAGVTIHLVDTPGFDDTSRHDSDILREISSWLSKSYTQKILLSGILYFHRISDPRMQGSGKMSIALLLKLCGKDAMKNVVLTTTMWEKVELGIGESRERELETTEEFWGFMKSHGSQVRRHYNNKESALDILSMFVPDAGPEPQPVALAIQTELADDRRTLDQTSVGKVLNGVWAEDKESLQRELREVREAMKTATEERDEATANMLRQQQDQTNQAVEKVRREQEKLRITMEELHAQQLAKMKEMLERQMAATRSLSKEMMSQQTKKGQQEESSGDQKQTDEREETVAKPAAEQSSMETSSELTLITVSSPEAALVWRVKEQPEQDFEFGSTAAQELQGHPGAVVSLVFTPSGKRLLAGTADSQIWIWDRESNSTAWNHTETLTCRRPRRFDKFMYFGKELFIKSLVLDSAGTTLIAFSLDTPVRFELCEPEGRFEEKQRSAVIASTLCEVEGLDISPDGGMLACLVAGLSTELYLFTPALTYLRKFSDTVLFPGRSWYERRMCSLAFSADGQYLALGTSGHAIVCVVEDKSDGSVSPKQILETEGIDDFFALAWSPDSTYIAAGDNTGIVWIWTWPPPNEQTANDGDDDEPKTGLKPVMTLQWAKGTRCKQLLFSPCGKLLVARSKEALHIWKRDEDGDWVPEAEAAAGKGGHIHSVAIHPEGNCIMVGREGGSITCEQIRRGD